MEGRRPAFFSALAGIAGALMLSNAQAGPGADAFYHQLWKTPVQQGYQPTRNFTIVTDEEHGNQLVAVDDVDLRFNVLWMQQYQPGYKSRSGGAALGEVLRGYLRNAYRSLRAHHAQTFSAFPDENGLGKVQSFSGDMEYHLNWSDGDLKLGIEYEF